MHDDVYGAGVYRWKPMHSIGWELPKVVVDAMHDDVYGAGVYRWKPMHSTG